MILVYLQLLSHTGSHLLAVASQHHGLFHTQLLQLQDGIGTVGLHLIVNDDMTSIGAIDGYMDDGTMITMFAVVPLSTHQIHHLRITHNDHLLTHLGADALTRDLLHIAHNTSVGSFFWEGIAQGGTNRMRGGMLHMGRQMQQLVFAADVRMHSLNGKATLSQCACLVKYHGVDLRQNIQVVGTFHQDTLS